MTGRRATCAPARPAERAPEAGRFERLLQKLRALELLHADLAEIVDRVADVGHLLRVAVDHLEGEVLALIGYYLPRKRQDQRDCRNEIDPGLVLHCCAPCLAGRAAWPNGWPKWYVGRL